MPQSSFSSPPPSATAPRFHPQRQARPAILLASLLALVCLLAGCGLAGRSQPSPLEFAEAQICKDIANSFDCARAIEARILPTLAGLAERRGALLSLSFSKGKNKELIDSLPKDFEHGFENASGQVNKNYSLVGYYPTEGFFLVAAHYYEGVDYLLIRVENGRTSFLDEKPVFCPDRRRFLVVSWGPYSAEKGVEVWSLTSGVPVQEFVYMNPKWPRELLALWDGPSRIRAFEARSEGFYDLKPTAALEVLELGDRLWQVAPPAEAGK